MNYDDGWVQIAQVERSYLDPRVWYPNYGADPICFTYPGRLRAVQRHCEQWAPFIERYAADTPLRWARQDEDCWRLFARREQPDDMDVKEI